MNSDCPLYLDHNATTPCDPRVWEEMLPHFTDTFWNPSSSHVLGRKARQNLEDARHRTALALGADSDDIVFTSGATEAINLALERLPASLLESISIRPTPIEHRAVQNSLVRLQRRGARVEVLPTDLGGIVRSESIREPSVFIVQAANSETGVIQDLASISTAVRSTGGLLVCDAAQALWKLRLEEVIPYADAVILSAHKAYGPKGVGALIASREYRRLLRRDYPEPAQEAYLREGTVNVAAAVGFAKTAEITAEEGENWRQSAASARDAFESALEGVLSSGVEFNLRFHRRLPNTSSVWIRGKQGDELIARANRIAVSFGSACSSGTPEPSSALIGSGLTRNAAHETVRVSFGRNSTVADGLLAARELSSL